MPSSTPTIDPVAAREAFEQKLDEYTRAVRFHALDAERTRGELMTLYDEAEPILEDGEFSFRGFVFGALIRSEGRIQPRDARNPAQLVKFITVLAQGVIRALDEIMERLTKN